MITQVFNPYHRMYFVLIFKIQSFFLFVTVKNQGSIKICYFFDYGINFHAIEKWNFTKAFFNMDFHYANTIKFKLKEFIKHRRLRLSVLF